MLKTMPFARFQSIRDAALLLCLCITAGLCLPWFATADSLEWLPRETEQAAFPSLLSSLRVQGPLEFCGEPVPLDRPEVREQLEKALLVLLWDRAQIILNIKRSGRFFPYIEDRLEKRGMPDDLKYIAVIESALRPHAGSHRGAVGYWQFIRSTARKYGLRVDGNIDERRNIFTSTEAALDFLTELHDMFGSWAVACAAYNMGENGMRKRIRTQGVTDYYKLYLPRETMFYLFRAIAAKMVFSDPAHYGFQFRDDDYYRPPEFDRVTVTLQKDTPVADIARAAGTHFRAIKDLNTQILGNDLVRGTHVLLLPKGASRDFAAKLGLKPDPPSAKASAPSPGRTAQAAPKPAPRPTPRVAEGRNELRVYVVRKGDNLHAIARRLGVPLRSLLTPNGLTPESTIQPGQRLLVTQ